jgi:hypothetical protein
MPGRAARRLASLAAPLGPERTPYYVQLPVTPGLEQHFPASGWYWVPHGHQTAAFLGASFDIAAVQLHHLNVSSQHQDAA